MKKLAMAGWTVAFVSMVVMTAHAVTWDVDRPLYSTPNGVYTIPPQFNGGYHFYSVSPFYFNDNRGIGDSSPDINQAASDTTTENFGSHPAQMIYQATGAGGTLTDGLYNTAFAEITHDLDTNSGVWSGHQRIVTDTFRNFIPDGNGTITVYANIAGDIPWEVFNYDWDTDSFPNPYDWHSGYRLQGTVEITPLSVTGGVIDTIDPITLDNATLSGSIQFDPIVHPDIYYVLHASLALDTYLENMDGFGFQLMELTDEIFRVGTSEGDPLRLMASVSQTPVPIPPSFVLFAFGIGALGVLRRRRLKRE